MDQAIDAKELTESHPMNSGDGPNSYDQNSAYQRKVISSAKAGIALAITESLNINIPQFEPSNPFRIADLGCSTGQNASIAMQNIVEAIEHKYITEYVNESSLCPEFQVFFNDTKDNDFNHLFRNLPLSKNYFAAGVPGSFYGRLFPEKSLHLVYSSFALHWLSKVPEEIKDKSSLAYNKDKIYCHCDNEHVTRAYVAQFQRDWGIFLEARAKELVEGGLIIIQMAGVPCESNDLHPSQNGNYFGNELLGESLFDMAKMGYISEEKVQSFNVPIYTPSIKLLEATIKMNDCFTIETTRVASSNPCADLQFNPKAMSLAMQSVMEGLIVEHFGRENVNPLFDFFTRKLEEAAIPDIVKGKRYEVTDLFAVLKRKAF